MKQPTKSMQNQFFAADLEYFRVRFGVFAIN